MRKGIDPLRVSVKSNYRVAFAYRLKAQVATHLAQTYDAESHNLPPPLTFDTPLCRK
jgi:hypothetical protein